MVLLISELAKIGAMKPIFLDSGSPKGEGEGVCVCTGMVCYHCIVHILNSSKNSIFFVSIVQSYAARLFGNTFLNFVSNFSPEGTIG